ncbi:MAG: BrnT family toxin [Pseudomonadota bacterium]
MYNLHMKFEWDPQKSRLNQIKHQIDFESAKPLWDDPDRIEIRAPYPLENRYVLIGRINNKLWSAIYTIRKGAIRIISVRHSRKQEARLYEKEKAREKQ